MVKELNTLLRDVKLLETKGNTSVTIDNLSFDSRKISKGTLFFAIRGTRSDGHIYIPEVINKGAVAIICEQIPEAPDPNICFIKVTSSEEAMGMIASAFYDHPSRKLKLVGITGTNGKTTTATLLYNLVEKLGFKAGLLSTVRNFVHDKVVEATHTTPDSVQINHLLSEMVRAGCEYCFMEVSSHSVVQHRITGLYFTGGVFTNITQDHLDYHKTFEEYIKAKKLFFDRLAPEAFALTNSDDRNGKVMLQNSKARKFCFGLKTLADYKCKLIESHFEGMLLQINNIELWVRLIGEFNAYNLLGIYATAILLGFNAEEVAKAISELKSVDGRFEYFRAPDGKVAIVDYAHTPDAVKNVLSTILQIRNGEQVISVLGAGGDRDKGKRPLMASVAAQMSDKVILTSDNPRSEEPEAIIADMLQGINVLEKRKVITITDRREAIRAAVLMALPGDIILVAGKGHETYQEIKGVKHPFDDREIIKELFQS